MSARAPSRTARAALALALLLALLPALLPASSARAAEPARPVDPPAPVVRPVQGPEAFTYNVYVFGAHSGVARLTAKRGRKLLFAGATLQSAGLFHTFFPVHNTSLSVIDRQTFLPTRYVMETDEKRSVCHYLVKFTPADKSFLRIKTRQDPGAPIAYRDFSVKGYAAVQDMVSSLMWLRSRRLAPDETDTFFGFSGNYLYQIRYRVTERGKAYTEAGLRDGVAVKAAVRRWDERKNQPSKDGWSKEVTLWFSADDQHVPLAIEVDLFVGAVRVVLAKGE